jgi:hypothetical protein
MTQHVSPRDMLQKELLSEVSSGQISSADKDALSAALDTIDTAMKSQGSASGGKPPSPDEMQSKLNDLIQSQVDSGALTSDQANGTEDRVLQCDAAGWSWRTGRSRRSAAVR